MACIFNPDKPCNMKWEPCGGRLRAPLYSARNLRGLDPYEKAARMAECIFNRRATDYQQTVTPNTEQCSITSGANCAQFVKDCINAAFGKSFTTPLLNPPAGDVQNYTSEIRPRRGSLIYLYLPTAAETVPYVSDRNFDFDGNLANYTPNPTTAGNQQQQNEETLRQQNFGCNMVSGTCTPYPGLNLGNGYKHIMLYLGHQGNRMIVAGMNHGVDTTRMPADNRYNMISTYTNGIFYLTELVAIKNTATQCLSVYPPLHNRPHIVRFCDNYANWP